MHHILKNSVVERVAVCFSVAAIVLTTGAPLSAATVVFTENFNNDNEVFDQHGWTFETAGLASYNYSYISSGMSFTDINPSVNNGWGDVKLTKTFTPVDGNFSASLEFSWASDAPSGYSQLQCRQVLYLKLLSNEKIVGYTHFYDESTVNRAALRAVSYNPTYGLDDTGYNVVGYSGSGVASIQRVGDTITYSLTSGSQSAQVVGVYSEPITGFEILLRGNNQYPHPSPPFFGTETLGKFTFTGQTSDVVPEPLTFSLLSLAIAVLTRFRRNQ